jgi:hypothetical protein
MARRTQTYAIRLAVEGGGQVKAELVRSPRAVNDTTRSRASSTAAATSTSALFGIYRCGWGFSTSQDLNGDIALIACFASSWTPAMVRRWHADPFGFLRPWGEAPAIMGNAPSSAPPLDRHRRGCLPDGVASSLSKLSRVGCRACTPTWFGSSTNSMNSTPSMAGSAAAARPVVVDLVEFAHHRRDRQIALPREAAVESAQKQQIHLDPQSISGLNEDDPLRRDLPDVVDRQPPGQQCGCAPAPADP